MAVTYHEDGSTSASISQRQEAKNKVIKSNGNRKSNSKKSK